MLLHLHKNLEGFALYLVQNPGASLITGLVQMILFVVYGGVLIS